MRRALSFSSQARSALLAAAMATGLHCMTVHAAPGAHGPNGEHLDAPSGGHQHSTRVGAPGLEAVSESFELVARLEGGELSILVDRYESNAPVLHAKVEVESNGIAAAGTFHADHGDYSVTDERLLKALSRPGRHPLIFTIHAGDESDLLEGTLDVTAAALAEEDDHAHAPGALWLGGIPLVLTIVAAALWHHRRRNPTTSHRRNSIPGN